MPHGVWAQALTWRALRDLQAKATDLIAAIGPLHERLPRYKELLSPYLSIEEQMEFDRFRHDVGVLGASAFSLASIVRSLEERGLTPP